MKDMYSVTSIFWTLYYSGGERGSVSDSVQKLFSIHGSTVFESGRTSLGHVTLQVDFVLWGSLI